MHKDDREKLRNGLKLQRYLEIRHVVEPGLWILLFGVIFVGQTAVDIIDAERLETGFKTWELITWKATSILTLLLLIPLILVFDRYCPIKWSTLKYAIVQHVVFSVVFSVLHVTIMILLRQLVYQFNGSDYDFGGLVERFGYEYLKDSQTYGLMLAMIYLYRHIILRLQGEVSLLGSPDSAEGAEEAHKPKRMLVKKLGREFLISVDNVERIEASGNYVNLHIANRIYPLRETMTNFEQRLDSARFRRIHRSHIVNLDFLQEIVPLENGDAKVILKSGDVLPMGRTYRNAIQSLG